MAEQIHIEYLPIGEIKEYYRNPRKNDNAVSAVAASIERFGFKNPIIVDSDNTIIAGHTRYKAAKKLGMTEVPVERADNLTPDQVQAYRLADNKTQELSKWDYGKLAEELDAIEEDMTEFGFSDEDVLGDFDKVQDLDDSEEISLDDFEDEAFNCTCPACGFKFMESGGGMDG